MYLSVAVAIDHFLLHDRFLGTITWQMTLKKTKKFNYWGFFLKKGQKPTPKMYAFLIHLAKERNSTSLNSFDASS